jgi:hypothetical protein
MSEPRNVTPGHEEPAPQAPAFRPWTDSAADSAPEWQAWSWAYRGRSFPWLGVLLVMVGAGLLIEYFIPSITAGTLILGALSAAFLAGFIVGGSYFAAIPGLLIGALVVARLLDELNIYNGPGVTALAVAVAFLLIWLIGATRAGRRRSNWPLWGAAIFGLVGFIEVSGRLSSLPELGALWPVAIIVIGLVVLFANRRSSPRRC